MVTTAEFALYSDASFAGGPVGDSGPYRFISTLPAPFRPRMRAGVVLRVDDHVPRRTPKMDATDAEGWLALRPDDEIAVLGSLALGVRLRSGGAVRVFEDDSDLRGRPVEYDHEPCPFRLPEPPEVLPGLAGRVVPFEGVAEWMGRFRDLAPGHALALMRAARHYRDALWWAEEDPEIAWLWLVSALETVAVEEQAITDPVETLGLWNEKVRKALVAAGDEDLLCVVAKAAGPLVRSTARYRSLIERYFPAPPSRRPETDRVLWERENLIAAATQVYGYRSKKLHVGLPFPSPMCAAPFTFTGQTPPERPPGLASAAGSSTWSAADLPMHLHTYAHITREVLMNWWRAHATSTTRAADTKSNGQSSLE
ncbi:hypothetical protein EHYA_09961 [Embleya hyalina]|uniref:Uncharacterized protein n=1 Tax=Embleya hyalina TaxID=516124 RepID=A0A401Z5Q4_9ACTN|nr:hypothetical protein EHYA_09961 [Embleya hyalina]